MTRWTRPFGALIAPALTVFISAAAHAQAGTQYNVSANGDALISIDDDDASATSDVVGPPTPVETAADERSTEDDGGNAEAPSARAEPLTGESPATMSASTQRAPAEQADATEAGLTETELSETEPPANESLGLGVPNGLFSARPAETQSEAVEGEQPGAARSLLTSIDPRNNPVTRVLASLGAVLGLLLLFKTMMKRGAGLLQGGRPSGVIEILGRYPLGRKQSLVLLKLARRVILLHQNGTQMTTLSEVSEPHEVAALLSRVESGSNGKQAQRFRSMLKRFEAEHETKNQPTERDDLFPALAGSGNGATGEVIDLTKRSRRGRHGAGKRRLRA